jgi:hypothetical protein
MNEAEVLGGLLPTSQLFQPTIQEFRQKYNLPEIKPKEDDPIEEIYLDDKIIPLDQFRQELQDRLERESELMPKDLGGFYFQAKAQKGQPLHYAELDILPDEARLAILAFLQMMMDNVLQIGKQYFASLTQMLYVYLLTGETEEVPQQWIGTVVPINIFGEPMVVAFATQVANPDEIVQQFRKTYADTFPGIHPKVSEKMVSTVYYMQLQRLGKKWDFIVEEYIRRNKFKLPRDKSSKKYFDAWNKFSARLKKRIQRSEKTLSVLFRDKK